MNKNSVGSIKASCACHVGIKRTNNEDNFYFERKCLPVENKGKKTPISTKYDSGQDCFFAVFDGMGGGDFGEVAAYTAVKESSRFLYRNKDKISDVEKMLDGLCRSMNTAVFQKKAEVEARSMGTTVVALYVHDGTAYICNVGDSRCYLLRDGVIQQLSLDHTDEKFMLDNEITDRKPYLTQYIGVDPEQLYIEPYICSCKLKKGDRFLLCSDGLTDMVDLETIKEDMIRVKGTEACTKQLIADALFNGGKDNITSIVIDVE